ncbi:MULTISPECIES: response regulator [Sphingobacterium]|uniref:Response regulator n=1 Tax=Sphingobacterium populi TaxID=1812824 RepID=A0ABW5UGI5_9SPHI|nr:response regulator [Sphingobacterium sp. CFCC 11742]
MASKVIIADTIDLYRFSLIGVIRACSTDIEIFEATDVAEVLEILKNNDISIVFININMLDLNDPTILKYLNKLQVVLVKDSRSTDVLDENNLPFVARTIELENSLESSKAAIIEILNN